MAFPGVMLGSSFDAHTHGNLRRWCFMSFVLNMIKVEQPYKAQFKVIDRVLLGPARDDPLALDFVFDDPLFPFTS